MGKHIKWTDELAIKEALKYTTKSKFCKGSSGAWNYSKNRGGEFYNKICAHMSGRFKWIDESLTKEALKYTSRTEFYKGSSGACEYAKRQGEEFYDKICAHMDERFKWTDESSTKEALKYKTKIEFVKGSGGGCNYARNRGKEFYEKICAHMDVTVRWTDESSTKEALKYTSKYEFHKGSSGACNYARKRSKEFYEKICAHMESPSSGGHRTVQYYLDHPEKGSQEGFYYGLLFSNKKDPSIQFIKMGITSRSVKERYYGVEKDWTYQIITEYQTTNLKTAYIERNFLHQFKTDYDYRLPLEMSFNGETELFTLDIIPLLEEFNKNTAIAEQYKL